MATTNGLTYRNSILDHLFRAQTLSPTPGTVYIGYSTDTVTSGSATEFTDSGYTGAGRPTLPLAAASNGSCASSGAVTFGAANSGHNVTGVALFSASSGGTQLTDWKAVTSAPVAIAAGQSYRLPSGQYTIGDSWA